MWYTRPVLFVADVNRAARFYIEMLGFEKRWHEGDGEGKVCQVNRGDCEIILCENAARKGKARLFIELNVDELAELRRELAARSVPSSVTWWGYDTLQIDDPDGNELFFPTEGNSSATVAWVADFRAAAAGLDVGPTVGAVYGWFGLALGVFPTRRGVGYG